MSPAVSRFSAVQQQLPFYRAGQMQQLGIGICGESYLAGALSLFSHVNISHQISVRIAQPSRVLFEFRSAS